MILADTLKVGGMFEDFCAEKGVEGNGYLFVEQCIALGKLNPGFHVAVLTISDVPVGFVDVMPLTLPHAPWATVVCQFCYILPEYRGKGGYRMIHEHVVGYGKKIGARTVSIVAGPDTEAFWGGKGFKRKYSQMELEV